MQSFVWWVLLSGELVHIELWVFDRGGGGERDEAAAAGEAAHHPQPQPGLPPPPGSAAGDRAHQFWRLFKCPFIVTASLSAVLRG